MPPVAVTAPGNELKFPFTLRRGIGLWKRLFLGDAGPVVTLPASAPAAARAGQYLVEGPGHCGECHTPRNFMMVSDDTRALAGAPHPEGKGRVPSLRDLIGRSKYESVDDLADALSLGELGGYDRLSSGGMAEVQANIAKLPEMDIRAIAEYLASIK